MFAWLLFTLMAVIAAVGVTIPLVRRYEARRAGQSGAPTIEAAEDVRDNPPPVVADTDGKAAVARPFSGRTRIGIALGLAAAVAVASSGLYLAIGRPDLVAKPPAVATVADAGHPGGDVSAMIGQLEAKMKQSPDDPQGWRMLGWSYMQTARFSDAANAYGRAAALDPDNAEYLSAQGEALTQAANGQVTPGARTLFHAALRRDPQDPRARYFLAVVRDQAGDHAGAIADWIALLKSAPPDATWVGDVRSFVERTAKAHGEDLTGKLPPEPPAAPTGLDADQVAAAQAMPPSDQQSMIMGMVEGLAARLRENPRDPDGWVRLMRARMVLGDIDAARSAYREALAAYADTPAQQAAFRSEATDLQIPGA